MGKTYPWQHPRIYRFVVARWPGIVVALSLTAYVEVERRWPFAVEATNFILDALGLPRLSVAVVMGAVGWLTVEVIRIAFPILSRKHVVVRDWNE